MRDALPLDLIRKMWPDADPEDIQEQFDNLMYQHRKKQEDARKRKNVISWVDARVLTKMMTEALIQLNEYAARGYEDGGLGGDMNVFVALIPLQKKIKELREEHKEANKPYQLPLI